MTKTIQTIYEEIEGNIPFRLNKLKHPLFIEETPLFSTSRVSYASLGGLGGFRITKLNLTRETIPTR